MLRFKTCSVVTVALLSGVVIACTRQVSYQADVEPIFQQYCTECHLSEGKGHKQSGFRVDSYENVMKGTRFGEVIVPGTGITSTLYLLVAGKTHSSIRMPHGQRSLSKKEIELIKTWIDQGAKNN
ncbi:MAG: c-type cytochrome domain-containing protein [Acidiferrobacterales bacterium]